MLVSGLMSALFLVMTEASAGITPGTHDLLDPPEDAAQIVSLFDRPAERWLAGHRGIDFASEVGAEIFAPDDGTITYAAPVAGRGVVVIQHPSGLVTSLEPVTATVTRGDHVGRGEVVGVLEEDHWHCADPCLHWGVRFEGEYVNPLDVLAGFGPVRLLPVS